MVRSVVASTLLLLFFLITSLNSKPATWKDTVKKVKESVVFVSAAPVEMLDPFTGTVVKRKPACTGFVIDRVRGLVATAAHCVGHEGLTAEGKDAIIVFSDPKLDVAIIETDAARRKPELRQQYFGRPDVTLAVAALGYGYDMGKIIYRHGEISEPGAIWEGESWKEEVGEWITTDFSFVGGMSGGPLFDVEGRVLGIVTQSDGKSGWARPASLVYAQLSPLPFPHLTP